jgi:hypothetical protein
MLQFTKLGTSAGTHVYKLSEYATAFKLSYLKARIQAGDAILVRNREGTDVTTETLLELLPPTEEFAFALIELLGADILQEIIRVGGIDNYKRRRL